MGKVISFANNKGGVGKTTTVVSIAQALAIFKKKVLCVDLDSQANLTGILSKVEPENRMLSIRDFFRDPGSFNVETVDEHIDLIPSDLTLATFDVDTSSLNDRVYLLTDLLEGVRNDYDFILIDCPPALGTITYNAFIASDYLVMVSTADDLSYKGLKMTYQLFQGVRGNKRLNPNLKIIGTIVTKTKNNKLTDTYLKKISGDPTLLFIPPTISEATKVGQAAALHASIYEYDPNGKATKQYLEVAQRLAARVLSDDNTNIIPGNSNDINP